MSVRARLRGVTAEIHEALHQAAPFARIAAGKISIPEYGELLGMLYRYHGAMAGVCAAGAQALGVPDLGQAQAARVAALALDMAHLGLVPPPVVAEPVHSAQFAAGCLYTVQGSTLGGKVIFRQLDEVLPDPSGRTFFQGTPKDGWRWQLLCESLEVFGRAGGTAGLEAGALQAFARFETLLVSGGEQLAAV